MSLFLDDGDVQLWHGDALTVLQGLPAESVHCCVTSPPFYGLRDYGTGRWEGGDPDCDHVQIVTVDWKPSCSCALSEGATSGSIRTRVGSLRECVVLDPFVGSGTVPHVARKHGRHAIGIDLSSSYLELAARRLQQLSLFAQTAP